MAFYPLDLQGLIPHIQMYLFIFNVFQHIGHSGNAKFIKTQHFINRSIRRPINVPKNVFYGFQSGPWRSQNGENFLVFTIFCMCLGLLVNLNMKNQPQPRLSLKCV